MVHGYHYINFTLYQNIFFFLCILQKNLVIYKPMILKSVENFWISRNFCLKLLDRHSYRSSHQRCSIKIGVLKNFSKFTGKHLFLSLWHRCFPVNFEKFLQTSFLRNGSGQLLLIILCTY